MFLLIGVAGFIPGITSNYDQLQFAGHQSGALLLGVFQVSVLHNIVHLLFGATSLASQVGQVVGDEEACQPSRVVGRHRSHPAQLGG